MKKLGIIFLTLTFLFSTFGLLPVKRVSANTEEERPLLMIAGWPWDEYSGHNRGDSSHNSGDNYVYPQNRKIIKEKSITPYQSEGVREKRVRSYRRYKNWIWKAVFYLQFLFK